jgi:hypothetical protein
MKYEGADNPRPLFVSELGLGHPTWAACVRPANLTSFT